MIGVDVDGKNELQLLKTLFNAQVLSPHVRVDATRKGYHLRLLDLSVDPLRNIEIRRCLGDDPDRVEWDMLKLHLGLIDLIDTLFQWKQSPRGTVSREEWVRRPLALPFYVVRERPKKNRKRREVKNKQCPNNQK